VFQGGRNAGPCFREGGMQVCVSGREECRKDLWLFVSCVCGRRPVYDQPSSVGGISYICAFATSESRSWFIGGCVHRARGSDSRENVGSTLEAASLQLGVHDAMTM
jgi:hypothetical protein